MTLVFQEPFGIISVQWCGELRQAKAATVRLSRQGPVAVRNCDTQKAMVKENTCSASTRPAENLFDLAACIAAAEDGIVSGSAK